MMYEAARVRFAHVAKRRSMYVMDDRFITAVAFVVGYDQALEARLLTGFGDWLCTRAGRQPLSNLVWWAVIEDLVFPDWLAEQRSAEALIPEEDRKLVQFMFEQLDAFLAERVRETAKPD
jgi:hypothetical protein